MRGPLGDWRIKGGEGFERRDRPYGCFGSTAYTAQGARAIREDWVKGSVGQGKGGGKDESCISLIQILRR